MPYSPFFRPFPAGPRGAFDDLRREIDQLFGRYGSGVPMARGVFPAVNLYETSDAYLLSAELPGVGPDDIHVSLQGSTVTLEGERKRQAPSEASPHRLERQTGTFRRSFELPLDIDADHVEARHEHGVLTLRLPKAPEHRPRQITVQSG